MKGSEGRCESTATPMASLRKKLLTSLAAVCAAAGLPNAVVEANAAELLRSAQASAAQLTHCPSTAEDLASGAALRLLEHHPEALADAEPWGGYLRRSVRNAFWDELRRHDCSRLAPFGDLDDEGEPGTVPESLAAIEAEGPGTAIVEEFRELLSAPDREVLDLLVEGHSDRRIAEHTRRSRHEVRSSVGRIRCTAERCFGAEGESVPRLS